MTPSDTRKPYPPRPDDRPRPAAPGMLCALAFLAIACSGGGGTTRTADERQAAPEATPAKSLPSLESLQVPSPEKAGSHADAERKTGTTGASSPGTPEAIEARALQAAEMYDAGKSAEAERVYGELLQKHPDHVGSLVGLAQILIDRDELDGAGALIERALKANPESSPALQKKVAWLLARDRSTEAVSVAEAAVRLNPKSAAVQAALGDAQRSFGDLPKAIAAYRAAVGLNPEWAPGWLRLGEALSENGDAADAQAALAKALERNPESYPAYRALARLYFDNGQPGEAVNAWGRALRLQPERGEAHEGMAEALLAARRPAEARRHAEEARRLGRNVDALLRQIVSASPP